MHDAPSFHTIRLNPPMVSYGTKTASPCSVKTAVPCHEASLCRLLQAAALNSTRRSDVQRAYYGEKNSEINLSIFPITPPGDEQQTRLNPADAIVSGGNREIGSAALVRRSLSRIDFHKFNKSDPHPSSQSTTGLATAPPYP